MRTRVACLLGVLLLGVVAGCAGEDLAKANFQRTTITATPGSGGQGEVPTGPIDDPAVAPSALRTVDPCALLEGDTTGTLGTPSPPEPVEWGVCKVAVQDAGGKTLDLRLTLAEPLIVSDRASGGIQGLPLIENKTDDTSCFVTAVTKRRPSLGITAQVDYAGGDPCDPGYSVLQSVLERVHADPPTYTVQPGSLLGVDPCETVADDVLQRVLGEVTVRPYDLHTCRFEADRPSVTVRFRTGYPPAAGEGSPIDLGNGVRGVEQRGTTDTVECEVSWVHRQRGEGESELASASFTFTSEEGDPGAACAKAVQVAKSVATSLPAD